VENRNYESWTVISKKEPVELAIAPFDQKLFHQDVFMISKDGKIEIAESQTRNKKEIPGILVLSTNKTYGRNAKGKLLYKCIPNDTHLPSFLVPHEVKQLGFSKVAINLFVTFTFQEWNQKHPIGTILQTIGPITEINAFYEYQMYCKEVNYSLKKMNQHILPLVKNGSIVSELCAKFPQLENRTHTHRVFSIDPEGSLDFDDAFSIRAEEEDHAQISIYIANVTLWLEYLNLWDFMCVHRVSTVYLPDNKRPMLPGILSDNLCSLREKEERVAFVLDINYCLRSKKVVSTKITNAVVCLVKNYVYEDAALLRSHDYLLLEKVVREMSEHPQMKYMDSLKDSHDIVAYLMIFMNHCCANMLLEKKEGIFRSIVTKVRDDFHEDKSAELSEKFEKLPENVAKFIKMTSSYSGKYVDLSQETDLQNVSHRILNLDAYIHITSPIRRMVDIINMVKIQQNQNIIVLSQSATDFCQTWMNNMDVLNLQMKQIRIVQNECQLLHFFTNNPDLLNVSHKGYTYHKKKRTGVVPILAFQYTVYLPEINMMTTLFTDEDLPDYACSHFKLFVFHNEDKMKRKIRIQKL
jgi:exoribonuclease R